MMGSQQLIPFLPSESTALNFSFVFSAPLPAQETCFQQVGSSAVEGTSQVVL
jgi:hypothetical protein